MRINESLLNISGADQLKQLNVSGRPQPNFVVPEPKEQR